MKAFYYISGLVAAGMFTSCGALWDADLDIAPDYYGVGVNVPFYGYMPGPPPIDPTLWGPGWNAPPPPLGGIRPGGNGFNPGFVNSNRPVGNIRPGQNEIPSPLPSAPATVNPGNVRPATGGGGGEIYRPANNQGRH